MVTRVEGRILVSLLARDVINMSKCQCCVWGCSNKMDSAWKIFWEIGFDCPLPLNKGCHRGEYLTLHNIHSMPEPVKRGVI